MIRGMVMTAVGLSGMTVSLGWVWILLGRWFRLLLLLVAVDFACERSYFGLDRRVVVGHPRKKLVNITSTVVAYNDRYVCSVCTVELVDVKKQRMSVVGRRALADT